MLARRVRVTLVGLSLLVVNGCQDAAPAKASKPAAPVRSAVSDVEAVELAKAYVLNNHPGAKILKVGPNLTRNEVDALRAEAGAAHPGIVIAALPEAVFSSDSIVRIRFKDGEEMADHLFLVSGKRAVEWSTPLGIEKNANSDKMSPVAVGDDWLSALRRELATKYPAIKIR